MKYKPKPQADLSILLEDTVLSYYWIGFLMADGYINHTVKRLKLVLANKDIDHVIKFANFIRCPNHRPDTLKSYGVSVQDKDAVPKIIAKFGFKPKKTYNPPSISNIDFAEDLFVAFAIGFSDGDARIGKQYHRKDSVISIKVHNSWLEILNHIASKLYEICGLDRVPVAKINKKGYASLNMANSVVLRYMKLKSIDWELPVISRKWDLIDENFRGKVEKAKERRTQVLAMHKAGFRGKDIALTLGVSNSCVSVILTKNRKGGI
jgi:hypothetical protein